MLVDIPAAKNCTVIAHWQTQTSRTAAPLKSDSCAEEPCLTPDSLECVVGTHNNESGVCGLPQHSVFCGCTGSADPC